MSAFSHHAYIALGSNLNHPQQQVEKAIQALTTHPLLKMIKVSALYQSEPLGPTGQPNYVNAVVLCQTSLGAHDLLKTLQDIEQHQGRVRDGERWGPRTLDLDLLLYDNEKINTPCLIVPHPEMKNRHFVLYPLADITPELILPDGTSLQSLLSLVSNQGLHSLGQIGAQQ